jgi:hypothetical protein
MHNKKGFCGDACDIVEVGLVHKCLASADAGSGFFSLVVLLQQHAQYTGCIGG